jgi:polynucleotide 5'-hydroxyl-kinase GRC3/NOL9
MKCALDLFAHYRVLLSQNPACALIINTPGWVLGTGLENLVDLITRIRPTVVIYMSQEGPWDVVNSLREAAKMIPVHTLPSQTCEYTTRTAAHLRIMQAMSYFHLDSSSRDGLVWICSEYSSRAPLPLTSIPPWEIRYGRRDFSGILGILPYGDPPSPEHLLDSINGSIVAVVVIDDSAALPGWRGEEEGEASLKDDDLTILHAENSGLPYFRNSFTLDPEHSHCIGLALIRGVDVTRRRLQALTPIAPSLIEEVNEEGKMIVLVSGKFDTPGWAYTEGTLEDSKSVPWVERSEGSQGRGVGGRVWRVRRDLGREGGD